MYTYNTYILAIYIDSVYEWVFMMCIRQWALCGVCVDVVRCKWYNIMMCVLCVCVWCVSVWVSEVCMMCEWGVYDMWVSEVCLMCEWGVYDVWVSEVWVSEVCMMCQWVRCVWCVWVRWIWCVCEWGVYRYDVWMSAAFWRSCKSCFDNIPATGKDLIIIMIVSIYVYMSGIVWCVCTDKLPKL